MKIDPDMIIDTIEVCSKQHFRSESETQQRLLYKIESLESQVRQLSNMLNKKHKETNDLQQLVMSK
jgi:archaellum component FlaC